ncbi:DUF6538 domain-containing protein [Candidatus Halocynthiibacter alkanivorans]|uniref:DUF6538 domain-containing protein n=1 Tax=Candidatus Halocynthiibacter alkanivorans TaxID=2267619 RepID=UPI003AF38A55
MGTYGMVEFPPTTLVLTKGKWYVNCTVPKDLRSYFSGRNQIRKSTGTTDMVDLPRYCSAPLRAYSTPKEINHGTTTIRRIQTRRSADRIDQRADPPTSVVRSWGWYVHPVQVDQNLS